MNTDAVQPLKVEQKTSQPIKDEKQKAKLQKAVQDFEAVFVNYLLKTMRKTINKDEGSESGFGGEMMQEMFDFEMAKHISRNSRLGIGEMLLRQMNKGELPSSLIDGDSVKASEAFRKQSISSPRSTSGVNVKKEVNKYEDIINEASKKYGVDASLLKAMMATESAGNPKAHSSANAKGLMQLIDSTATMLGVDDVWDPEQNIHGGAKYMKQLLEKFNGDTTLAVASYNAGPERVAKNNSVPAIPETLQYVKRVMKYMDIFSENGEKK
jgi:soluble lytic murein transglycosylase-like protein